MTHPSRIYSLIFFIDQSTHEFYRSTLTIEDLLYSPGAAVYDETAAKIDAYFIAEAIRTAYPQSVESIFSKSNILYPSMPAIELLELRKTDSKTLGLIIVNEGTLDGSYEVMESIYKHQF